MATSRITEWSWWKTRKKGLVVMVLLSLIGVVASTVTVAEDTVNVISVENMDTLLRMRMVDIFRNHTDLEGLRFRRWTPRSRPPPPPAAQVEPLCSRRGCQCQQHIDHYLNVTCVFESHEVLDIVQGSLPASMTSLHVSNLTQLRILPYAFASHAAFSEATFKNVGSLQIQKDAFLNLSLSTFMLNIESCGDVTLEEQCYHSLRSPLDATIMGCDLVFLQSQVFSWLLQLHITNVPSLHVVENTFKPSKGAVRRDPTTNITFHNVTLSSVPNATFALSARVIMFVNCVIGTVMTNAFNAIEYSTIHFQDTQVEQFEARSFDPNTLVHELTLTNVSVQRIGPQLLTAVSNLTIRNCRIGEVASNAFDMEAATVHLASNHIIKLKRHAFQVASWNKVVVEGNRFDMLEPESMLLPFQKMARVRTYEFQLVNNVVVAPSTATLSFIPKDPEVQVTIRSNKLDSPCHCHLPSWVNGLTSARGNELYLTSFCVVNDVLARCFNLEEGFMKMANFTEGLCNDMNRLVCEEAKRTYRADVFDEDNNDLERRVLAVIFLGVMSSVAIMLLILSGVWLRRKGLCGNHYSNPPSSICSIFSRLFSNSNLVTTASISRININEYAEIQNQLNQTVSGHTILAMEEQTEEEEEVPCEDKATQTLPEELTQELLQSLREKLDDPDNYNEARDMIEHLYDLIKVEESCNNNNSTPRTSLVLEDEEEPCGNLYDVIQPRKYARTRRKQAKKEMVSTGTRAPSPDKLQPVHYHTIRPLATPAIVSEYFEPRDRTSHEYCELPGLGLVMPDVLGTTRGNMVNRPLPERPDRAGTSY